MNVEFIMLLLPLHQIIQLGIVGIANFYILGIVNLLGIVKQNELLLVLILAD